MTINKKAYSKPSVAIFQVAAEALLETGSTGEPVVKVDDEEELGAAPTDQRRHGNSYVWDDEEDEEKY